MLPLIYRIPLIGWMLRDALEGHDDAPVWFAVNLLLLWILGGVFFGLQGMVIMALIAVPTVFVVLTLITAGR